MKVTILSTSLVALINQSLLQTRQNVPCAFEEEKRPNIYKCIADIPCY